MVKGLLQEEGEMTRHWVEPEGRNPGYLEKEQPGNDQL